MSARRRSSIEIDACVRTHRFLLPQSRECFRMRLVIARYRPIFYLLHVSIVGGPNECLLWAAFFFLCALYLFACVREYQCKITEFNALE